MEHITSADGTRIAVQHSGHGPALILVVGAFCDRTSTASLAAGLTDHFTVYEYDRRGPWLLTIGLRDVMIAGRMTGPAGGMTGRPGLGFRRGSR